ncbi:transferase, partial [Streptomyces hyaluromycini]
LLRDSERRERLGAAARARALELFTVEQNIAAFHGIYLEIVSHCPVRRVVLDQAGEPLPFAVPAEAHVPGRWTGPTARVAHRAGPGWALGAALRPAPVRATPLAATEGAL